MKMMKALRSAGTKIPLKHPFLKSYINMIQIGSIMKVTDKTCVVLSHV